MAGERLFDFDPDSGVKTWFSSSDADGGTWTFRKEQDVSPILDRNKASQAEGFDRKADWWHAGHIPNVIIEKWRNELGIDIFNKDHMPAVKKLLNDSDWLALRPHNFKL